MFSLTLRVPPAEHDELIADLWEAGTAGITESEHGLCAFFENSADRARLMERFSAHRPEYKYEEEHDWAGDYRRSWPSFPVGERFFLVPDFRDDPAPCGRIKLRIYPGRACGTGAHPATQLCLQAMERYIFEEASVLDLGTGSGILAEASRLLGADCVIACDIDPEAAIIARNNLRKSLFHIPVVTGSIRSMRSHAFDVIVANINFKTLASMHEEMSRVLKENGNFILSGFREKESELVTTAFGRNVLDVFRRDDWTCLVL